MSKKAEDVRVCSDRAKENGRETYQAVDLASDVADVFNLLLGLHSVDRLVLVGRIGRREGWGRSAGLEGSLVPGFELVCALLDVGIVEHRRALAENASLAFGLVGAGRRKRKDVSLMSLHICDR